MNPAPAGRPLLTQRWLELVCLLLVGLTPLFGYLGYLGFAPLVGFAGLLATPALIRGRKGDAPLIVLAVLCLWAGISLAWSPAAPAPGPAGDYGGIEKLTIVKLALELGFYSAAVAAVTRLPPAAARRVATVLAIGLVPMAAIYVADAFQRGSILLAIGRLAGDDPEPRLTFKNAAQTAYVLAMLVFPAVLIAVRRRWLPLAAGLVLALLTGTLVTGYTSPLIGFLVGALAWAGVRQWGRPAARALIVPVTVGYLIAPFAVIAAVRSGLFAQLHKVFPLSWDLRLDIWAFAADKTMSHPLRGLGFDAARTFPGAIPLHTHDAPIQLWLELGLPGAALVAGFFGWMLWRIGELARTQRDQAAVAAGALMTYIAIGALSFGVWQEWWLALGALALIVCRIERRGWTDAPSADKGAGLTPLGS